MHTLTPRRRASSRRREVVWVVTGLRLAMDPSDVDRRGLTVARTDCRSSDATASPVCPCHRFNESNTIKPNKIEYKSKPTKFKISSFHA